MANYQTYFQSGTYIKQPINSVWYAFLITLATLLISYPTATFLHYACHCQLWLLQLILPTWINLYFMPYAFIGIFSQDGGEHSFLGMFGIAPQQFLLLAFSFIFVAAYIAIPFKLYSIFNAIVQLPANLVNASRALGAMRWQTLLMLVWPLTISGVKSGVQAVFIPS